MILQRKTCVLNQEEVETEKEANQSWGGVTSQRRTSHGLSAEFGELMHSDDRSARKVIEVVRWHPGM